MLASPARVGGGAGMIFYKKELESDIDQAVFPGLQGGPHNHTIAGLAVALKMARGPEFVQYQKQVIANARALSDRWGCLCVSSMHNSLYCVADASPTHDIPGAANKGRGAVYGGLCAPAAPD